MKIETLSVFPQCYDSVMNESIMRIAQEKGFLDFKAHDLRNWTHDKHRTTDDEPYGGGQGLVMKCEPIFEATDELFSSAPKKPYVISLGDYVLTSGELASMVVIDAVVRRIDGVLGDEGSAVDESFYDGLLEYPQYTRPASYRGMDVPDILLSGHHAKIAQWRREQSLLRTKRWRPDLLEEANLSKKERDFLDSTE